MFRATQMMPRCGGFKAVLCIVSETWCGCASVTLGLGLGGAAVMELGRKVEAKGMWLVAMLS